MKNIRIYVPGPLAPQEQFELPQAAAHHVLRVLRLKPGDAVTLFDGRGGDYDAVVVAAGKRGVTASTSGWNANERESMLDVALAQAISGGERMDYTLQKAVELGITRVQPIASARSVVRLSPARAVKRVEHWQKVVISACEQCGRNRVPEVAPISGLAHWLQQAKRARGDGTTRLMLSPAADARLRELPRPQGPVVLLAGPEGGFDASEASLAAASGFTPARLGPRTLRSETAAVAALAAIQALWGDF